MRDTNQFAIDILRAFGFSANDIPESRMHGEQRADILASDGDASYVIEVKNKTDNPSIFERKKRELDKGEVISWAAGTAFDNGVDGILKKARKQVNATPDAREAFRLVWFHADGIDHDARWKKAYSTFYGRVYLFPKSGATNDVVECFYFDWTASHAMPSIDALVLSDDSYAQLCLNEFSTQRAAFRRTSLYRRFADASSVVDPVALASAGSIIACRFEGSRKNEADIIRALESQTGTKYDVIRFAQHSAAATVDPRRSSTDEPEARSPSPSANPSLS